MNTEKTVGTFLSFMDKNQKAALFILTGFGLAMGLLVVGVIEVNK